MHTQGCRQNKQPLHGRAERALRSMGVLLSDGTNHVSLGLEEATRGLPPCDTLRFSHPPPNTWVPQNSEKKEIH